MDCKQFKNQVQEYLDKNMDENDMKKWTEHEKSCTQCSEYIQDIKLIQKSLNSMMLESLPENFENELHQKLINERDNKYSESNINEKIDNKKSGIIYDIVNTRWVRYGIGAVAVLFIAILMTGVGTNIGGMKSEDAVAGEIFDQGMMENSIVAEEGIIEIADADYEVNMAQEPKLRSNYGNTSVQGEAKHFEKKLADIDGDSGENTDDGYVKGRLLIKSADMALEVENYDEVFDIILNRVQAMGGFVGEADTYQTGNVRSSDSEEYLKQGYIFVRVPQEKFDIAIESFATLGNQTRISISSEDVTTMYRDVAEEVNNLKVREKKLREIMEQAKTVEDTIKVERELSTVRNNINHLTKNLKNWERLVAMSSIRISIDEVGSLTPQIEPIDKTLGEKIRNKLIKNLNYLRIDAENKVIDIIANLPFLIINIITIIIVFLIIKHIFRWIIKKKNELNDHKL